MKRGCTKNFIMIHPLDIRHPISPKYPCNIAENVPFLGEHCM